MSEGPGAAGRPCYSVATMTERCHPEVEALAREEHALASATGAVPLACPTRERWVCAALAAPETLLDDHAQCELKAASNALAILGRNPERDELVRAMSALAKEEMVHYRLVRSRLLERGGRPSRPVASPYLKGLGRARRGGAYTLLDDLLVAALVEARSCERFVVLARGLRGPAGVRVDGSEELAAFYERLARSESGHAQIFTGLAERYFDPEEVASELRRRSEIEAEILESLPVTPRMHGGHCPD